MTIQSINPFTNIKIKPNTANITANSQQNIAKKVNTNNKNTAAIIGGVAALAILGTGALVAIKRHKVPNEIKTALNSLKETNEAANALAQSAKKQADEVTEYAQKLFNEVSDLFKKGDEIDDNGNTLRAIKRLGPQKIMEEYTQDGKIFRKSSFLCGKLYEVQEGVEEFSDGSVKIAKRVYFTNDQIGNYEEGIEKFSNGVTKTAKEILFDDLGEFYSYAEGKEELPNEVTKTARSLSLYDGKLSCYKEGIETKPEAPWEIAKMAKCLIICDCKHLSYDENCQAIADSTLKATKSLLVKDRKPVLYQEGAELINGKVQSVAKEYQMTEDGWKKVIG